MALRSELEENPYAPPIEENAAAQELDRREQFDSEEDYLEAASVWPRCPQCGRRRITRCPICKTSSDLFPLGDSSFWDARTEEERAIAAASEASAGHSCSCGGSCGCGHNHSEQDEHACQNRHDEALYEETERNAVLDGEILPGVPSLRRLKKSCEKTSDVFDGLSDERERAQSWAASNVQVALCHICSEAFTPEFPRVCEWCGYDFGDGVDRSAFDSSADENGVAEFLQRAGDGPNEDDEANVSRVLLTVVVLGALVIGLLVYMSML